MKLSFAEKLLVNSPLRAFSLRVVEPAVLESHVPFPKKSDVLDIGCGNGHGLVMLHKRCDPASLTGVDIDAAQLAHARARLMRAKVPAQLVESAVEHIPLPAHDFDCITSFGCIHHVENWQAALTECARLLRHGGLLYALEFYRPLLCAPVLGWLFKHPPHRFTHAEFTAAVQSSGFTVCYSKNIFGLAGITIARLTGNAHTYD